VTKILKNVKNVLTCDGM